MAEEHPPSEEELRKALEQVGVADVLLGTLTTVVSLGYHRVSAEARDLPQAKLAIDALRALEPVLREAGVDDGVVRDLEQARTNLQLAYAKAVSEAPADAGPPPADEESAERPSAEQPPSEEAPTED